MSLTDCKFTFSGANIYNPKDILPDTDYIFTVTNYGLESLTELGFYLVPATSVGDVDNPADFPRETDYQDILTWGSKTQMGVTVSGGLKIIVSNNEETLTTTYFSRNNGAHYGNRILIEELSADESLTFTLRLETPPGIASRRFFVSLVLN